MQIFSDENRRRIGGHALEVVAEVDQGLVLDRLTVHMLDELAFIAFECQFQEMRQVRQDVGNFTLSKELEQPLALGGHNLYLRRAIGQVQVIQEQLIDRPERERATVGECTSLEPAYS